MHATPGQFLTRQKLKILRTSIETMPDNQAQARFMGAWPEQSHYASNQEGHVLGSMICYGHLKILNNCTFGFVFGKGSTVGQRASVWADETCPTCVSAILCQCIPYTAIAVPHEHRILRDPQCVGVQQDLKPVKGHHVCYSHDWAHGGTESPERPYFPFEPEFAQTQKEDNSFLRNMAE